jgi:hypothetical protein
MRHRIHAEIICKSRDTPPRHDSDATAATGDDSDFNPIHKY